MLVSFARSTVLLLIAFIIFAIYGLVPRDSESEPVATATWESAASPTLVSSDTPVPSPTTPPTMAAESAASETPDEPVTREVEPTFTPASTLQAKTALVNSFNGLWLRSEPDPEGESLELIPNETVLIVLQEEEPGGQPEWQRVRSPSGLEGWVFIEFIIYQQDE
jgi:hypothetical protein